MHRTALRQFMRQGVRRFSSENIGGVHSVHAVQLQQELALRQIFGGTVTSVEKQPVAIHRIPGPEQPHCEAIHGKTLEVSWEADTFANGYTLRHLGKGTKHVWTEVAHDDLQFNDGHVVAHSLDTCANDTHLVQIRAHYGDFTTEWSAVRVNQTGKAKPK